MFMHWFKNKNRGRRGCDCMVVGFTTTCAITAYHHLSCVFKASSWRGVLDTTLCDKSLSVTCDRSVEVVVNPTTIQSQPRRPRFLFLNRGSKLCEPDFYF
jgi:hypothetical protein